MSKGQRNHARQPVARVKGRETSQARQPGTGGVQPRGKTQGGMIKNRNGQPAEASARQGQARANGGKGRAPQNGRVARDAYGNPLMHEGTPLFKLSRREQEQQQMQQAQGRNKPVYQRDSNGDVNGNVAWIMSAASATRTPRRRQASRPPAERRATASGQADGGKPQLVQKAKKLRLRSPNQDIRTRPNACAKSASTWTISSRCGCRKRWRPPASARAAKWKNGSRPARSPSTARKPAWATASARATA